MGDGESARQCFLVEWYQPGLAESTVDAAIDRLAAAAVGLCATLIVAVAAPADETLFGIVAADSSDIVVAACREAGWHVDRITAGVRAHIG
ncbi:hypothetical protein [Mycolicibacter arupensis]|jgi:hypothetical protein|uniref:DUF4242 domain-containing protein n=1 Tax=Mycolicibacter arupensis TaxID=342002 RepID=A0A0F5MWI2_9MYCO|nr:hypothetical protein [Mycolicibacter arupensis]KKB98959.1 hypothetical protein WR43_11900 [Mycolicibacter arupensis]MCV7275638.1 hypothetical protein [Mycolicibacter arupensis]OQZ94829.1 hypothetical protein BST15_15475 [Mycolicibacter arupensis]TXI47951.1 MAG: hypothetical protein E6Q54_24515 [Mycolicibacter arupensis]